MKGYDLNYVIEAEWGIHVDADNIDEAQEKATKILAEAQKKAKNFNVAYYLTDWNSTES